MGQITKFRGKFFFLSNFYECDIEYNGILYPSVEHAYQAQKTLNDDTRYTVSQLPSASDAKHFSKTIKIRDDWDNVKLIIMKDLLFIKFQHDDLKKQLLETDGCDLIESNDRGDIFWGVCNNQGANMLGILLTYVRDCIKNKTNTHGCQ